MATFSEISAAPRYRRRASTSVPSLPRQTLQLAALGTDVSRNVSLNRSLARNIPPIEFSGPLKGIPEVRSASVPRSIDTGSASPQTLGDPAELSAFGKAARNKFFPSSDILGHARSGLEPGFHSRTQPFSFMERTLPASFGGATQQQIRTSGMGAGAFSDWFR